MGTGLSENSENSLLRLHPQVTQLRGSEHSRYAERVTMSTNPTGDLVKRRRIMISELTVLARSFDDLLSRSRFEALLLLPVPVDGAEGGGSVIRLHCTPCLAQFVHGLSSSHCQVISVCFCRSVDERASGNQMRLSQTHLHVACLALPATQPTLFVA